MKSLQGISLVALTALALTAPGQAQALLRDDTGIEAIGRVDLDGRLRPNPPLSDLTATETLPPYTRSVVAVADSAPNFSYFAEADIGNQTLKVMGELANQTAASLVGDGLPILFTSAQLRDTLTLHSTLPGKQVVTLSMAIDGELSYQSGIAIAPKVNAQLFFGPVGGVQGNDSNSYGQIGTIADTLSVSLEIEGPTTDVILDTLLSFAVFFVPPGETVSGRLDNTARLTLALPAGVTLAGSTSGTFGEVITPVPVPAALPLLASALLLVRRRQAA